MTEYALHPYALLFPPMTESEYLALKDSIRQHGQRDPIVLWGDLENQTLPMEKCPVLDGRNRLQACEELGVTPKTIRRFMTEAEALQYVLDANLHRRHLTDAQRAAIAAEIATLKKGGQETNPPIGGFSQADAADKLNVSVRSIQRAAAVKEENDALHALIKADKISPSLAEQVTKLTPEQQEAFLDKVEAGGKPSEVYAALKRETESAKLVSELLDTPEAESDTAAVTTQVDTPSSQFEATSDEEEFDTVDGWEGDAPGEKPELVRSPYYPFPDMDARNAYVDKIFLNVHDELTGYLRDHLLNKWGGQYMTQLDRLANVETIGFVSFWKQYLTALQMEFAKLHNKSLRLADAENELREERAATTLAGQVNRDAKVLRCLDKLAVHKGISLTQCLAYLLDFYAEQGKKSEKTGEVAT